MVHVEINIRVPVYIWRSSSQKTTWGIHANPNPQSFLADIPPLSQMVPMTAITMKMPPLSAFSSSHGMRTFKKETQKHFIASSPVAVATEPIWTCYHQGLPDCLSKSQHLSELRWSSLYTWPPITGAGSSCQNMSSSLVIANTSSGDVWLQVSNALNFEPKSRTKAMHSISCGRSFLSISWQFVVHMYFMISSMLWLLFSMRILFSNITTWFPSKTLPHAFTTVMTVLPTLSVWLLLVMVI